MKTNEGILSFLYKNSPAKLAPADDELNCSTAWFEEHLADLFKEQKPPFFFERVKSDGVHLYKVNEDGTIEEKSYEH